jgi:hypothetical protein
MYPIPPITGVLAHTGAPMVPLAIAAVTLSLLGALSLRMSVLRRLNRRR